MVQRLVQPLILAALGLQLLSAVAAGREALRPVGVARIDITPNYPIRLSGYAVRKSESEGVAQHLYAKALALGSDRDQPAVLITVDNCGVPGSVREEVVRRLRRHRHLEPARLTICSTHTHSAPWLKRYLPNLFGQPLPPEQQARVDRYTRELTDALETVALQALADRRPARLSRGVGQAGFAANRRTKGGPVDQEVPALFVTAPEGHLRAILASYACHCTTLGGDFNQICGDWAGFAQELLEQEHAGTTVLITLGCAGDANPSPRPGLALARQHGQAIATAVNQVRSQALTPVTGKLVCRTKQIQLPFAPLPTRAEWEARAQETNYSGSHARLHLARLDRGESLPTALPYLVQAWSFGDDFALVFLPGEVVVDYSLRLKRECAAQSLWVNAYANDVPCYIPSERVLREGGYEGDGAMIYYDWPTRFAPGVEQCIVEAVKDLLPRQGRSPAVQRQTALRSPKQLE